VVRHLTVPLINSVNKSENMESPTSHRIEENCENSSLGFIKAVHQWK